MFAQISALFGHLLAPAKYLAISLLSIQLLYFEFKASEFFVSENENSWQQC